MRISKPISAAAKRYVVAAAVLGLGGCSPVVEDDVRKFWSTASLVSGVEGGRVFAGFRAADVVTLRGTPILFRSPPWTLSTVTQSIDTDGLTVLPAFSNAQPAAYVVTELWNNHPDPWVQPVYILVSGYEASAPTAKRLPIPPIFAVGVNSSFYTPFWRGWFSEVPESSTRTSFASATEITNAKRAIYRGPSVLCPIIPEGVAVSIAEGEADPRHPFTLEPVSKPAVAEAWVDGRIVRYLAFGFDTFDQTEGGSLVDVPMYFFTKTAADGKPAILPVPPILPDSSFRHAYVRRHDVTFDTANWAVFVPAGKGALQTHVEFLGLSTGPVSSAAIPEAVAQAYTLRVATNPRCFSDASMFPSGCSWLDSVAAIQALPKHQVVATSTTLTVGVLRAEGKNR